MDEIFEKLTKKLKEYENVLIMSHINADLDGFASSILLCQISRKFGKNSNIFLKEKNENIKKVDNLFSADLLISNCEKYNPENTLLVILDTNSFIYLEEPKLIDIYNHILIIDHHVKGDDLINNSEMCYINGNLSSVIEFMTFYIKHIDYKIEQKLATLMLAGLEIDTDSFNLKTTPETYKAAGMLVEMGASHILKQTFLREPREKIIKQNELLKKSYIYKDKVCICVLDDEIYKQVNLAQVADLLLHFKNVELAFCLGYVNKNQVRVSIRTIGNYNAGEFAVKFGGGGSIVSAAASLNCSLTEAEEKIKRLVGEII